MKVISENVGPMVVDTVKKLIEEAIPRIKEFLKTTGIEKIGEAGKDLLPTITMMIDDLTGKNRERVYGKEVETLDMATLVEFTKRYVPAGSNEVVAIRKQEADGNIIFLAYSKDKQLLPVDENHHLIFKAGNLAEEVSALFAESEVIIIK